jgi:hypothetical protein
MIAPEAVLTWRPLDLTRLESLWESAFSAAGSALQAAAGSSPVDPRELAERRRALTRERTETASLLSRLAAEGVCVRSVRRGFVLRSLFARLTYDGASAGVETEDERGHVADPDARRLEADRVRERDREDPVTAANRADDGHDPASQMLVPLDREREPSRCPAPPDDFRCHRGGVSAPSLTAR